MGGWRSPDARCSFANDLRHRHHRIGINPAIRRLRRPGGTDHRGPHRTAYLRLKLRQHLPHPSGRRAPQVAFGNVAHQILGNRASADECRTGNRCDRTGNRRMHVIAWTPRLFGDVSHVRTIDLTPVVGCVVVPRHEGLIPSKRHPRIRWANARVHAPAVASEKCDQRGRINRASNVAAGAPRPTIANAHPATVVRRRKAPRCIIHPRPAPRLHPAPAAIAVRCPARRNARWIPNAAILVVDVPTAVLIELAGTHHPWVNAAVVADVVPVSVALRSVVAPITRGCPRLKATVAGACRITVKAVEASPVTVKHKALAAIDRHRRAVGKHLCLTCAHGERGRGVARSGGDHIKTGLKQRHLARRGENAHRIGLLPSADTHNHRAA